MGANGTGELWLSTLELWDQVTPMVAIAEAESDTAWPIEVGAGGSRRVRLDYSIVAPFGPGQLATLPLVWRYEIYERAHDEFWWNGYEDPATVVPGSCP